MNTIIKDNIYKDDYIKFLFNNHKDLYNNLRKDDNFLVRQIVYAYLYQNGFIDISKPYTKVLDESDNCFIYFEVDFKELFQIEKYLYYYFNILFKGNKLNAFNKTFGIYTLLKHLC